MELVMRGWSVESRDLFFDIYTSREKVHASSAEKLKRLVTSSLGKGFIGLGLGVCMPLVYAPITKVAVKIVNPPSLADPLVALARSQKISLFPRICLLAPVLEEVIFRGGIQEGLKGVFEAFYGKLGVADPSMPARVTSIFFTSLLFGLSHFANALAFKCSIWVFFPQVVATFVMGLMMGAAKEISRGLAMPIGMHIGNNTLAWGALMMAPSA